GARVPPPPGAAGYHASTSTLRGAPEPSSGSLRALSMSRQVVVATGYVPVGAGSSNGAGPGAAEEFARGEKPASVAAAIAIETPILDMEHWLPRRMFERQKDTGVCLSRIKSGLAPCYRAYESRCNRARNSRVRPAGSPVDRRSPMTATDAAPAS